MASKDLEPCLISTFGDYSFVVVLTNGIRVCTCISNPPPSLGFIETTRYMYSVSIVGVRNDRHCTVNEKYVVVVVVLVAQYIVKLEYFAVISYSP